MTEERMSYGREEMKTEEGRKARKGENDDEKKETR